jgi:hypothetical protein
MRLRRVRFGLGRFALVVAALGGQLGLILRTAYSISDEPTANEYEAATFLVLAFEVLIAFLAWLALLEIRRSRVIDVLTYRGPLIRNRGLWSAGLKRTTSHGTDLQDLPKSERKG